MIWMIASDLHGSKLYCEKLFKAFDYEGADRMLLLGDLLYHGPRNDLPEGYDPKAVIDILNSNREKLLCVRGNCDAEVDQMVLSFPIMAEYAILNFGKNIIFAAHGHTINEDNPPALLPGDILLCGHTHIPACNIHEGYTYMNPGSVSIPKAGSRHGYMVYDESTFIWKDFDGNIITGSGCPPPLSGA